MFSIFSELHTRFLMSYALTGRQENCIPMLYSGTLWRLINQNPRTLFPYPLKPSMFPKICAHYVVLGNADPIAFAYSYSESGCFDTSPLAYSSIDIVSVGTLLSASDFRIPIPDSTHLPDITILVCAHSGIAHPISPCWYAIYSGIAYPISASWYAIYPGVSYQIPPYWYAEYLGVSYQISPCWYTEYLGSVYPIPPYRYAVYFGNVYHVSPYWYANACINKRLPIAAYHLADTHTRCQKIPAR